MTAVEHEHRFRAFATDVRVLVTAPTPLDALRVQALFQRLHRALTRFDPASELGALNAGTGGETAASPVLLRALAAALWAARASGGLVDPTILDALEQSGYAASRDGEAPAALADALAGAPPRAPAAPDASSRWPEIELDPARHTVRVPAGVRLDLGGTAKGLAADLAAGILAGHRRYAVDAGGDLRIGGTDAAPRAVHITHPLQGTVAHSFSITDGAVATSGLHSRIWRTEGGFAHHLIDPARRAPAWTGVIQATALAATALEAETLAKTALLRGPADGLELLDRHGGALILDDGRLRLAGPLATRQQAAA
jgi:thiamine biosynthesis lipoprotein